MNQLTLFKTFLRHLNFHFAQVVCTLIILVFCFYFIPNNIIHFQSLSFSRLCLWVFFHWFFVPSLYFLDLLTAAALSFSLILPSCVSLACDSSCLPLRSAFSVSFFKMRLSSNLLVSIICFDMPKLGFCGLHCPYCKPCFWICRPKTSNWALREFPILTVIGSSWTFHKPAENSCPGDHVRPDALRSLQRHKRESICVSNRR